VRPAVTAIRSAHGLSSISFLDPLQCPPIHRGHFTTYEFLNSTTSLGGRVRSGSDDSWTETVDHCTPSRLSEMSLPARTSPQIPRYSLVQLGCNTLHPEQMSGNKLVSLLLKPRPESTSTTTTFAFDSKEYSRVPDRCWQGHHNRRHSHNEHRCAVFYRYSADNTTWVPGTSAGSVSAAPYHPLIQLTAGYRLLWNSLSSRATGHATSNVEPAPPAAQGHSPITLPHLAYYPTLSLD